MSSFFEADSFWRFWWWNLIRMCIRKHFLHLKLLCYFHFLFKSFSYRNNKFFFFENGLVDVISMSECKSFYLIKNLRVHPSTSISWDIGTNSRYFSTKLYDIYYISRNIGYKVLSFKPKSMLDEVNYYFRITLKGKNSLFLTKVIFISVESSNLGIMLANTTF